MTTSPDDAGGDSTGGARRGSLAPRLAERERSLITIAALAALHRTGRLRDTLRRAPGSGVTRQEWTR